MGSVGWRGRGCSIVPGRKAEGGGFLEEGLLNRLEGGWAAAPYRALVITPVSFLLSSPHTSSHLYGRCRPPPKTSTTSYCIQMMYSLLDLFCDILCVLIPASASSPLTLSLAFLPQPCWIYFSSFWRTNGLPAFWPSHKHFSVPIIIPWILANRFPNELTTPTSQSIPCS